MKMVLAIQTAIRNLSMGDEVKAHLRIEDEGFDLCIVLGPILPVEDGPELARLQDEICRIAKENGHEMDTPLHYEPHVSGGIAIEGSFYNSNKNAVDF